MCGRTTHIFTWGEAWALIRRYTAMRQLIADGVDLETGPPRNYNAAPKSMIPVIRGESDALVACEMQWWLVPAWSKSPDIKYATFNARSEDAAKKPAFRSPFKHRRCVIPVSGFYEWKKLDAKNKQPYYITRADGEIMFFAGLWDRWKGEDEELDSCTILTVAANEQMRDVHDRMPCILEPEAVEAWLDQSVTDAEDVAGMLRPAGEGVLAMHPVSSRVGNVRNKDAGLIERTAV